LVNLVEDWEVLQECAGDKQGYYQLLSTDGAVEARVAIGRLGFKKHSTTTTSLKRTTKTVRFDGGSDNPRILGLPLFHP
jgi:hypothetical protein